MGRFVKICSLANRADVQVVRELKPDAMGFILWDGSKRGVTEADVAAWTSGWRDGDPLRVGVFVDDPVPQLVERARNAGVDTIQLHREPSREDWEALREAWDGELWVAVNAERVALDDVEALDADRVVLDSGTPEQPGGTGKTGAWDVAARWVGELTAPVLLAGGLRPGNVADALRVVNPAGVDVSSGVEAEPGRKDLNQVEAFIEESRNA